MRPAHRANQILFRDFGIVIRPIRPTTIIRRIDVALHGVTRRRCTIEAFRGRPGNPILHTIRGLLVRGIRHPPEHLFEILIKRDHHPGVTSLDEIDNRLAALLERLFPLIVDVVRVDVPWLHLALDEGISQSRTIRLEQLNCSRGMVVVNLGVKLPGMPAGKRMLSALPHFPHSNMILEISLHVQKRTPFDECLLSRDDRVINIPVLQSHEISPIVRWKASSDT